MMDAAKEFLIDISQKKYKSIIFTGPTETGKTFLINEIKRFILAHPRFFRVDYGKPEDLTLTYYYTSTILVNELLNNNRFIKEIQRCKILFIEEFLSQDFSLTNSYNSIIVEKMFEILNLRAGKITIMDTNKSIEDIERIDKRIKSRLFRHDGIVVDIPSTTTPYLSRKCNKQVR